MKRLFVYNVEGRSLLSLRKKGRNGKIKHIYERALPNIVKFLSLKPKWRTFLLQIELLYKRDEIS